MARIGFPISTKENEKRRDLLPRDLSTIRKVENLVFEEGYGDVLGYSDKDYSSCGATVTDRSEIFRCPIICNAKPMVQDEYFQPGKTLFGWIHAVQGRQITDLLVNNRMTAIAWEEMFEGGRHSFWRNNEISGEAAVNHAFFCWGRLPYESKVAVIGRGNVARGALRILERFGCNVIVYDRKTSHLLISEIGRYDVIVNAVLWDVFRKDHLVYEEDLKKMKPGSLIIDISCDEAMGIETTHATTIDDPVYWCHNILHYAVDHTPTLYYKTASESISEAVAKFINDLVEERPNKVIEDATIIRCGEILDQKIICFQNRM